MVGVSREEVILGLSLFLQPMAATLLSTFGPLALSLAAVGLYGVMAYVVDLRTLELGIRISIRAQRMAVFKLVLSQGLSLTVISIFGGMLVALAARPLTSHLLYGVSATDPITFTLVPLLLIGVAFLATLFPARRATRIEAMIGLRYD